MKPTPRIPTKIVKSIARCELSSRQVEREFQRLQQAGMRTVVAGQARRDPQQLLSQHRPKHKLELFGTRFYITNVRQIPELRFYVAYVVQPDVKTERCNCYPRIFYKDLSLAWRSASHFSIEDGDIWVGKGDVRYDEEDGFELIESIEGTTDLPLEMQTALERLLAWSKRPLHGDGLLDLVLRKSGPSRIQPYADFLAPRQAAMRNRANLIHGGKSIARFRRKNDPTSLRLVAGYQPDFSQPGIIEQSSSTSRLYGGKLKRFRILSSNRLVQFYFVAGSRHVWLYPPQAMTNELSSYGVRTVDVAADDDLFIPGYEYHYYEEKANGRELYSQIPAGFAGAACPVDDAKADASPWLDQIPLIQEFRRRVLKR